MEDLYCPACGLVITRRRNGRSTPAHCPRCIARARRVVALLALDQREDRATESLPARREG